MLYRVSLARSLGFWKRLFVSDYRFDTEKSYTAGYIYDFNNEIFIEAHITPTTTACV